MSWRWFLLLALPCGSLILLGVVAAKRWRDQQADPIEALIAPPVVKFTGHDEALAQRTRARREQADRLKADGRRLDTKDDGRSRIHMVTR
jgi:hypothetical protein